MRRRVVSMMDFERCRRYHDSKSTVSRTITMSTKAPTNVYLTKFCFVKVLPIFFETLSSLLAFGHCERVARISRSG